MICKFKKNKKSSTLLTMIVIVFVGLISLTGCSLETNHGANNDTKDIVNSGEETEPNQGTSESYHGEWIINQVQAYGVGTYSSDDAESLLGKNLTFTANKASYFGDQSSDIEKVSTNPIYTETIITESDFVADYRIPFDNLGVRAPTITEINVSDSNGNVCTFFIKDDNTLIIYGGGTYFELVRKDTNKSGNDDIDIKETQDLGYIKSIDTENKTITIDKVELLFETDEERLNKIGMKSEDLPTGFYIYNEDENEKLLTFDGNLSIELLDGTSSSEASLEELEELLLKHDVLCEIIIKDNVVVKISEQYLP